MTEDTLTKTKALLTYMEVPAAVHFYHWHQIVYDTHYPDFWPPLAQTAGYFKQIQQLGGKVMPYINCHLIDKNSDSWKNDDAGKYIVLGPGLTGKEEVWSAGNKAQLVSVCPGTKYWQEKFNGLTTHLVRDLNVDGIYCDQVACVPAELCFNPNHGHPVGGGYYWVAGHNRQIDQIRSTARKLKPGVILATESAAEPYDFDVFLRCNEGAPFLTPIWQMVYSGYRLSYGFYFNEPREWIVKFATQYLWGIQIGWAGQHNTKDNPENAAFEREVARARYAGSAYLAMGEMLRPPVLTGKFDRIKTVWRNFAMEIPIDWPAVQGSLWRAPDGSIGLALVNMAANPQEVTFRLSRKELAVPAGTVQGKFLYPAAIAEKAAMTGETLTHKLTLPGRSVAMYTLTVSPQ